MAMQVEYGIVVLLDSMGTRERLNKNINSFLVDWNSILTELELKVKGLQDILYNKGNRKSIRIKDIFDNVQIFCPTDDPILQHIDLTGNNPLWWTIQYLGFLLIYLIRFGIRKGIYFRGCVSMGHIKEYRNGFFSTAMIENADLMESLDMIGMVIGPSAMRVLNNRSLYAPKFNNFIRYDIPRKKGSESEDQNNESYKLAVLNLDNYKKMFIDSDQTQTIHLIDQQITSFRNDERKRQKWERTREFVNQIAKRQFSDFL